MRTICVANKKGGVGKTTVAFNTIHALSRSGARVLAIDNDAQGDLSGSLASRETDPSHRTRALYDSGAADPLQITDTIHLLAADPKLTAVEKDDIQVLFNFADNLDVLAPNYDYCLVDCAPSLGQLTFAGILAAHHLLIPLVPTHYAVDGLAELLRAHHRAVKRLNARCTILGILFNLVDARTALAREMQELVRADLGDLVFQTALPKAIKYEESPGHQLSIWDYAPNTPAASSFDAFFRELTQRLALQDRSHGQNIKSA